MVDSPPELVEQYKSWCFHNRTPFVVVNNRDIAFCIAVNLWNGLTLSSEGQQNLFNVLKSGSARRRPLFVTATKAVAHVRVNSFAATIEEVLKLVHDPNIVQGLAYHGSSTGTNTRTTNSGKKNELGAGSGLGLAAAA